jgi:phosphatidylglycerophosphate synthase
VDLEAHFAPQVHTAADVAPVERALLASLDNPRDGRVDTVFNRRLSRPLSRLLLRTPLTPNQITAMSFAVALLAAAAFASGAYAASLLGALLFQFSAVLDCCDGEVARLKFSESKLGDVLDISLDALGNGAVFLGMARGAWVTGRLADAAMVSWVLGAGVLLAFAIVTWAERRLPPLPVSRHHQRAQRLMVALTTRDFSVLIAAAAALGLLPWFLRGAAIGAHVFWIVLLVLLMRGNHSRGQHPA